MGLQSNSLSGVSWHSSLDKEVQSANLWTSCPAILTKTANQVKLIIPEAGTMAHTFQPTVCTGEVEPQRRRLACWVGTKVVAGTKAFHQAWNCPPPKDCPLLSSLELWASPMFNALCTSLPLVSPFLCPIPSPHPLHVGLCSPSSHFLPLQPLVWLLRVS